MAVIKEGLFAELVVMLQLLSVATILFNPGKRGSVTVTCAAELKMIRSVLVTVRL